MNVKNPNTINNRIFDITNGACFKYVRKFRSINKFLTSFRQDFHFIIAYHGTRINDLEHLSIKTNGLVIASIDGMRQKAIDRLILSSDPEPVKVQIESIIDDFFISDRPITIGEVNTVMDRELFTGGYHYLLFGPESLLPLADRIRRELNIFTRRRLVDFGQSAIVKVQIPTEMSKDLWIKGIYEYINNGFIDVSLVIRESLASTNIIDIDYVSTPYDSKGFVYM
ncbi:hypothetical protein BDD43_4537 [Mucilaginibacter gracilis]|uniref:Uncharacterized protein n=1 Tax=Mucilaginibacter gracilis TaxID=423350 RepID=A0A495J5Q3_9SPHI|nr:hypothetical protein [Mucilaginibacter gracilis]RKR84305.1 hypothetical protein BDD43_4537 [Mucilaginibacter gracilis]